MVRSGTSFRELTEFVQGRKSEDVVAGLLQLAGFYVIDARDYDGRDENKHAPVAHGSKEDIVLPDLDVFGNKFRCWCEVKDKTKADWTHVTQRYEHGIDLHLYDGYLQIRCESGQPVWVIVVEHEPSHVLLIQRLYVLAEKERFSDEEAKMSRTGMVFFPRQAFIGLGCCRREMSRAGLAGRLKDALMGRWVIPPTLLPLPPSYLR